MWAVLNLLVLSLLLIGSLFLRFPPSHVFTPTHSPTSHKHTRSPKDTNPSLPTRRDGVVFFSDASTGAAREAALALTTQGFHVLIGSASPQVTRSFAYLARKGLELIPFDLQDPTTYPETIYRLRHIRRDLDRPLVGIVLNIADNTERELATQTASSPTPLKTKKTHTKHAKKTRVERWLDVDYGAEQARRLVKSPQRVLHALLELARIQTEEGRNPALERKMQLAMGITTNESTASEMRDKEKEKETTKEMQLGGVRVTLLVADMTANSEEERETLLNECGMTCVYHRATVDYFASLGRSNVLRNASISIVPTVQLTTDSLAQEQSYDDLFAQNISWAIEEDAQESDKKSLASRASKAIVHSMIASSPLRYYDLLDKKEELKEEL